MLDAIMDAKCEYKCVECGSLFTKKQNLKRHYRTHRPQQECFVCDKCGKFYSRNDNLKRHQKNECKIKAKGRVCDWCSYGSQHKATFQRHLRSCKKKKMASLTELHTLLEGNDDCKVNVTAAIVGGLFRESPELFSNEMAESCESDVENEADSNADSSDMLLNEKMYTHDDRNVNVTDANVADLIRESPEMRLNEMVDNVSDVENEGDSDEDSSDMLLNEKMDTHDDRKVNVTAAIVAGLFRESPAMFSNEMVDTCESDVENDSNADSSDMLTNEIMDTHNDSNVNVTAAILAGLFRESPMFSNEMVDNDESDVENDSNADSSDMLTNDMSDIDESNANATVTGLNIESPEMSSNEIMDNYNSNIIRQKWKNEDGVISVRNENSSVWHIYTEKPVTMVIIAKRGPHKKFECQICRYTYRKCQVDFHVKHAHNGGKICVDCCKSFFDKVSFKNHECSFGQIFQLLKKKAVLTRGLIQFRVFALPLRCPFSNEIVWWIGKSVLKDINDCIEHILRKAFGAFINGYEKKNGCTSLIELIYDTDYPFEILRNDAFFFDLPGGDFGAADCLKNLLRRVMNTPGHCKSLKCLKVYEEQRAFIFNQLLKLEKMPNKHMLSLKSFESKLILNQLIE